MVVTYQETVNVFAQLSENDEMAVKDYAEQHNCSLNEAISELVAQNEIEPWDYIIEEELEDMSEITIFEEDNS